jgi:hypothetical protein
MQLRITGLRDGKHWPAVGGTIEVPPAEAAQLVAQGIAVLVPDAVETAAVDVDAETAAVKSTPVKRTPRKRAAAK